MKESQIEQFTDDWNLFQKGVEYKNRIGLYATVDKNYRFFQGDQWNGVEAKGLPTPVFNLIKPVLRYKISTIMQNDIKINYSCGNVFSDNFKELDEVAKKLTGYAEKLWEKLKMDFYNTTTLTDASITGDGVSYYYFDEEENEVKMELIDSVNIYPANPNVANIQEQDYIIISFRRTINDVINEAKANGLGEDDIDLIKADNDTINQAGDSAKIELNDNDKCIVLLKMWKDKGTGTVKFRKSTRDVVIVNDSDTGLKLYPVAMFNWEPKKNSFHGTSDVTELIPNQIYVNKIAAMRMLSTMYTAFPKMVYDENLVSNPSNDIGVAIGVNGIDKPVKNIIDYITPSAPGADAYNMFERTITLTKELMGANEGALGSINPEKTSGKAILVLAEQSAVPLNSHKQRFYNYIEDIALIFADMWRAYTNKEDGKDISLVNENGEEETGNIQGNAFEELMLTVKIDVGPASRWNELALCQTLDNLLIRKYIPFDWYVDLMPENSGFPKAEIKEKIKAAEEEQKKAEQNKVDESKNASQDFDIDAFLESLPPEVQQQAIENPQMLEQLIAEQIGNVQM